MFLPSADFMRQTSFLLEYKSREFYRPHSTLPEGPFYLKTGQLTLRDSIAYLADRCKTLSSWACYGAQKGDGTPIISAEEQQRQTADALAAGMNLQ